MNRGIATFDDYSTGYNSVSSDCLPVAEILLKSPSGNNAAFQMKAPEFFRSHVVR